MECTNGQPAGYRRHREQSNPNAATRDQNGANKNPLHHRGFYRPPVFQQIASRQRADERTRTAYPCSLRVITQVLQEFAGVCKSRISKPVSLLSFAGCCTVLRSRWYQSGVNRGTAASRYCSRGARTQSTFSTSPRLVSIQLILDRYSHWMLSLAETLRTRCTSHWVRRSPLALRFPSVVARVHAAPARRGRAAKSSLPHSLRRCSR
jgi:hypothetical protein